MAGHSPILHFEDIYKTYSERILNLVYRMTHNEEVARDLTQEIFIKVYKNLGTFKEQSQLYTWIHSIAVHHVLNYLKREKRASWFHFKNNSMDNEIQEHQTEEVFVEQTLYVSPDKAMEQDERSKIVWCAIESLSAKYRIPFILFHYESTSYKEISEMMNLSMSAVESRIHRAKKQLIKKLEPMLDQI